MGNFWYKQMMVNKKNSAINYNIVRYLIMTRNLSRQLATITLFAVAMAYLESAVVVYLREIYYPEGFGFPLKPMSGRIALTEIYRELATMVMLAGIGYLSGRNRMQRFGVFLFTFGTWDIFYYIFLYLLIGWPQSLLTWDILFLIPVTWVGPVLAPSINALSMCILGGMIYYFEETGRKVRIRTSDWTLLVLGSGFILVSYTQDYIRYMVTRVSWTELFNPASATRVMETAMQYIPDKFSWIIFAIGQLLILMAILLVFKRTIRNFADSK